MLSNQTYERFQSITFYLIHRLYNHLFSCAPSTHQISHHFSGKYLIETIQNSIESLFMRYFLKSLLTIDPFGTLATMADSQGLVSFQYSDDRGGSWMEIRPPPTATIQVPFYGYRTHSMRLIVNCHLEYWLEALGQCVRWASFRSLPFAGSLDVSEVKAVLDLLAGGATLCYGCNCVQ